MQEKRQKTSFTNLETHGDGSGYLAYDTCSSGVPREIVPAGIVPIGNILVGKNLGVQARTKGVPFVTETMEKAVAALVGSIPELKPYTAIKGKARAERRHHIQTIMRELLVDPEAIHDHEDPRVVRAIGLWTTGRRLKLSIR